MKKLGIMTAMDEEFRNIAQSFHFSTSRDIGPRRFLSTTHNGLELTLVPSRIGKVAAAVTTSILIHEYEVDAILFTGVAGSVRSGVGIGDIVIADHLVQHDIDLKGVLGYERFDIPLVDVREMASCPDLVRRAMVAANEAIRSDEYREGVKSFAKREPSVHLGTIASGDTFVCDHQERDALASAIHNLHCVEMEGASVAQVCLEHGVPFVVARIVSDEAASEAAIDFGAFIASAASIGSDVFVRRFVESF